MSWNDGYKRKVFEEEQKKQADEYRSLGMPEEKIRAVHNLDLEQYKSERRYHMHTQPLASSDLNTRERSDDTFFVMEKYKDRLTVTDDLSSHSRYWWVEEIDDVEMAKKVKSLSKGDLEILTLMVMDGITQEEIAEKTGVSLRTIERKKRKFKKLLRKT